jgi:hypothetical protein
VYYRQVRKWLWILAALALAGCDDEPDPPVAAKPAGAPITGRCPVTIPDDHVRTYAGEFNHGDRSLAVLLWPKGRLVAGPPDGSTWGEVRPDGTIYAKLGWWRGADGGQLRIEGERLDGRAPPLRADIPHGYGPTGFQATALLFPTTGCWRVVATAGDARLEFVSTVRKTKRRRAA